MLSGLGLRFFGISRAMNGVDAEQQQRDRLVRHVAGDRPDAERAARSRSDRRTPAASGYAPATERRASRSRPSA